jgi:hypothetical protein
VIAIVAPEPAAWLPALQTWLTARYPEQPVRIFAPWTLPDLPGMPGAWRRRTLELPSRSVAGWQAVELAARLWARQRTDRRMTARFLVRRAVDSLAARWLPPETQVVVAPSLGALHTLARGRLLGARTVLLEDLPGLRGLHADLDAALRVHPDSRFLRTFRASAADVARQEQERVLADQGLVRGLFALGERQRLGHAAVDLLEPVVQAAPWRGLPRNPTVLLAGLASTRSGVVEALAALQGTGATLRVRVGEGLEPRDLLQRPGVEAVRGDALAGVAAVLAPAWVESQAPEVVAAARAGLPVVGTLRGLGRVVGARVVDVGDVVGLRVLLVE